MLAYLTIALDLTSNPIALAGYIGLGVYATTTWRAFKYAVLWGLAVQIFALARGPVSLLDLEGLIQQTCFRLVGALIVTMGVFYLYRFMRRGRDGTGGSGSSGNSSRRKTPHLRRVK